MSPVDCPTSRVRANMCVTGFGQPIPHLHCTQTPAPPLGREKKKSGYYGYHKLRLERNAGVLLLACSYHAASQLHYVLSVCKCVCVYVWAGWSFFGYAGPKRKGEDRRGGVHGPIPSFWFLIGSHVVDVVECGSNVHRGVN